MERILEINALQEVTKALVEAGREARLKRSAILVDLSNPLLGESELASLYFRKLEGPNLQVPQRSGATDVQTLSPRQTCPSTL
jgi:hypothetical protein